MTQLMQQFDRLISCHRRKIVKEFVERMASRQIVKQTLHRNTGSGKYGSTAHYVRRTRNNLVSIVAFIYVYSNSIAGETRRPLILVHHRPHRSFPMRLVHISLVARRRKDSSMVVAKNSYSDSNFRTFLRLINSFIGSSSIGVNPRFM